MRNPLHVNDKARKQGILLPKFKTRVTVPPPPPHEGLLSFKNYKKRKKIAANIQRIISTQMSFRCQYRWGGGVACRVLKCASMNISPFWGGGAHHMHAMDFSY